MTNSTATFIRLVSEDDKSARLSDAIHTLGQGEPDSIVFTVNTGLFDNIGGSPFAYWISSTLLEAFVRLPPFECDERTAKQGLATADDFRFVRACWEVPPAQIVNSELAITAENLRRQTQADQRWVPLAKGGPFSRFHADVCLLVDWKRDGATIRTTLDKNGQPAARYRGADFYFRSGLTWSHRSQRGFSLRALPRGCIYSHKGPALFFSGDQEEDQLYFLGLMNSRVYADLLALQVGFGSYDVGVIQKTPVAWPIDSMEKVEIGGLALRAHALARQGDSTDETAHGFVLAALARPEMSVSEAQTKVIDERIALTSEGSAVLAQIDRYVAALYGLSEQETALLGTLDTAAIGTSNGVEDLVDDEELKEQADVPDLLMWCFGCALGRWDVRFALDPSRVPRAAQPFDPLPRCAPGALTGLNCLPAYANDILDTYPLRIDWDGILVDDQEHVDDITRRIRDVLAVIWNERAAAIEGEVCEALSVRTLADYIRRPAGFFGHHLQRYSKSRRQAPIYWPFSTASGSYTLWLYYHRLTSDTLYTGVNKYVAPKIEDVQRGLAEVERQLAAASGGAATKLRDQREKQQAFLNELEAFRTELLRVAGLPYRPNLDDGVIINAAPLWKLFRLPKWQKATRETWEKLERGDYDWAHLAYRIWPERVREKCRTDKSLAIAHGLEELYSAPAAEATRGRGKGRKPAALIEDDE